MSACESCESCELAARQITNSDGLTFSADRRERLAHLAALEAGWWDGEGLPMHPTSVATAARILRNFDLNHIDAPGIFPSPDGVVRFEWLTATTHRVWECMEDGTVWHFFYDEAVDGPEARAARRMS